MRFALKNKKPMYYTVLDEAETKYKLDDDGNKIVVDVIDGVTYYEEEGTTDKHYAKPVKFNGTIKAGGSNAQDTEFGLDISEYSAVLVLPVKKYPINENSFIWVDSEPKTIVGTNYADVSTADYSVVKMTYGLNTIRYALKKVVKNEENL